MQIYAKISLLLVQHEIIDMCLRETVQEVASLHPAGRQSSSSGTELSEGLVRTGGTGGDKV